MESNIEFKIYTHLLKGEGTCSKITEFIEANGYRRVLIFCDGNLYDHNDYVKNIVSGFRENNKYDLIEFREKFEPTYSYLDMERSKFGDGAKAHYDCVIAIGGGSCIDSAKGLATLATNPKPAIEYRGFPKNINSSIPIVAVPSTVGTGSELAFNAVFIDLKENKKLGINSENNYPVLAVLDPFVVVGSPRNVIASSGLDALVHTLESYISIKANNLSRLFSEQAFNLIINNLSHFYHNPSDINSAANMQLGAFYAMAGLSNSSSGPSGALSYLVGTKYNINHGIAGALFIAKMTRLNFTKGCDYSSLFQFLDSNVSCHTEREKSEEVVKKIEYLVRELCIPDSLIGAGIPEKDFNSLKEYAVNNYKGAFSLNPINLEVEDLNFLIN